MEECRKDEHEEEIYELHEEEIEPYVRSSLGKRIAIDRSLKHLEKITHNPNK